MVDFPSPFPPFFSCILQGKAEVGRKESAWEQIHSLASPACVREKHALQKQRRVSMHFS